MRHRARAPRPTGCPRVARPMMEIEAAATAAGRLHSFTSPGRWVTRKAM